MDPERVRALRERIGMPIGRAAELSGLGEERIRQLEADGDVVDIEDLRRLAKAYNRNWYVFLLEELPGRPSLPRDFRRLGSGDTISDATWVAFDDAHQLLDKIVDLPREHDQPVLTLSPIAALTAEEAAGLSRSELGATLDEQWQQPDIYASLRFWTRLLTQAGVYVAQLSFPYREVRAFCLKRGMVALVVVSSQDSPAARIFSVLHELGHLLLGNEGMCTPQSSGLGSTSTDEEPFCNAFAGALLMPREAFRTDPAALALSQRTIELGDAVGLARRYGVSELAALRRLVTAGLMPVETYRRLHARRAENFDDEPLPDPKAKRIRKQATRMINENSRLYAVEVLDAHARGDIPLRDVGVLLDGNLKHLDAIRAELAR